MNNLKYVMLPRIEEKPRQIKQQPWYRERFREKYLKRETPYSGNKERLLNAREWVFIKDGLDDFRNGLPPSHDDVIIKVEFYSMKIVQFSKQFFFTIFSTS